MFAWKYKLIYEKLKRKEKIYTLIELRKTTISEYSSNNKQDLIDHETWWVISYWWFKFIFRVKCFKEGFASTNA